MNTEAPLLDFPDNMKVDLAIEMYEVLRGNQVLLLHVDRVTVDTLPHLF